MLLSLLRWHWIQKIEQSEIIKTKNQNRNMKSQNSERRKPSFTNRICRKYRLIWTRTEQNNDHTRIIHKIQFRSSFNASGKLVLFWIFKVSIRFVFMRSYAETLKKIFSMCDSGFLARYVFSILKMSKAYSGSWKTQKQSPGGVL